MILLCGGVAHAQDEQSEHYDDTLEEIIVTAGGSRLPADLQTVPGSVVVIDSRELELQAGITSDLGEILANQVPGMGPSTNDANNFSQTIRGRKPAFFIDGIPMSASLRGGGRDLRIVNTNVLERVEIIEGATAIYGLGGSGGIVNYVTRRPPAEEGVELFTEAGLASAASTFESDGLEYSLSQGIAGRSDRVGFVASAGYLSRGLFYDAEGDPIPPDPTGQTGIADMNEWSLFGKSVIDLTENVRWEVMGTYHDSQVDTDYTIAQGDWSQGIKSVAEPKRQNNFSLLGGFLTFDFIGEDPSSHNTLLRTGLVVDDVLGGSTLEGQVFYQDAQYVWRYLDFLAIAPTLGGYPPEGSQLVTDSSNRGARVDIRTPFAFSDADGVLLWGLDYTIARTQGSFADGQLYTSRLEQQSIAPFLQVQTNVGERFHIRAGLRYDDFNLDIPDFMARDHFDPTFRHQVVGTELDYDNVSGNFGVVYDFTDTLSVTAAWSQGFSIGDVMRAIRGLAPQIPLPPQTIRVGDLGLRIQPTTVDSYETGLRFDNDRVRVNVTGFYSRSDLGATFDPVTLETVRAPERIWGVELGLDADLTESWRAGISTAIQHSKMDRDADGTWDGPLDFSRVPPTRMLAYVESDIAESWTVRLQTETLFDESRFEPPFGTFERDVEGYSLLDLYVRGKVLDGTLSFGVENLLNKQYFPLATYMGCQDNPIFYSFCAVAAPGARASIQYSLEY
ncbi:MAG TPA: TonB-dependent receptor [Woeseiaceae bacterium]|nr:TonB-dependent receptor [Woeseiaceae bacterium]